MIIIFTVHKDYVSICMLEMPPWLSVMNLPICETAMGLPRPISHEVAYLRFCDEPAYL